MWFINDQSIRKYGFTEAYITRICADNGIILKYAFSGDKLLGKTISDLDYDKLIKIINDKTL